MSTIIGIDPGKSGGVAILEGDDAPRAFGFAGLTEKDIWQLLAEAEPANVWLEKVGATPQMGVTSAFSFGRAYGSVRTACIAAGLRLEEVAPAKWQQALRLPKIPGGIGKNDTAKKNRNKAKAQELFPGIKITHAIADALLIAEYGRRQQLVEA